MDSRAQAIIRYDGPALAKHEMDVRDLAPALLAMSDLCTVANEVFNGQSAYVKVLVRTDTEHKCFALYIELVQTLYEQLTTVLDKESVQDTKNILEWLGLLGAGGVGLFGFYKKLFGTRSDDVQKIEAQAEDAFDERAIEARVEGESVIYQIVGDNNEIIVPHEVHRLAQDPRALPAVKKVLAPLQKDGYEKLEFEADGRVTQYFTRAEAKKIIQAPEEAVVTTGENEQVSTIKTSVRIRKPAFEGTSKWGIMYKRAVEARIADEEWLQDYQEGAIFLGPGSKLIVDLKERWQIDEEGRAKGEATYTILKVHGVEAPSKQFTIFGSDGEH